MLLLLSGAGSLCLIAVLVLYMCLGDLECAVSVQHMHAQVPRTRTRGWPASTSRLARPSTQRVDHTIEPYIIPMRHRLFGGIEAPSRTHHTGGSRFQAKPMPGICTPNTIETRLAICGSQRCNCCGAGAPQSLWTER